MNNGFVMVLSFSRDFYVGTRTVEDLRKAYVENRLERRIRVCIAPKLLLFDEVSSVNMVTVAATIFFQLVSARYEFGSIVLTSNKSFGEWAEIFGDPMIGPAILDRLLPHSHVIHRWDESYRLKEKKRAGSTPAQCCAQTCSGVKEGYPAPLSEAVQTWRWVNFKLTLTYLWLTSMSVRRSESRPQDCFSVSSKC